MNSPQTFQLPWPPSTNGLWRSFKGRNIKSKRAREWVQQAGLELIRQHPKPTPGQVRIGIKLKSPYGHVYDLDNRVKAVLDLLVEHQIIEADDFRYVRQLWVETGEKTGAEVTITPLPAREPMTLAEAAEKAGEAA